MRPLYTYYRLVKMFLDHRQKRASSHLQTHHSNQASGAADSHVRATRGSGGGVVQGGTYHGLGSNTSGGGHATSHDPRVVGGADPRSAVGGAYAAGERAGESSRGGPGERGFGSIGAGGTSQGSSSRGEQRGSGLYAGSSSRGGVRYEGSAARDEGAGDMLGPSAYPAVSSERTYPHTSVSASITQPGTVSPGPAASATSTGASHHFPHPAAGTTTAAQENFQTASLAAPRVSSAGTNAPTTSASSSYHTPSAPSPPATHAPHSSLTSQHAVGAAPLATSSPPGDHSGVSPAMMTPDGGGRGGSHRWTGQRPEGANAYLSNVYPQTVAPLQREVGASPQMVMVTSPLVGQRRVSGYAATGGSGGRNE